VVGIDAGYRNGGYERNVVDKGDETSMSIERKEDVGTQPKSVWRRLQLPAQAISRLFALRCDNL
jgi:hypothetical protein